MSAKKWCIMFASCVLLITVLLAGFNFVTDPVGVFGDYFFDWYSYNMTKNPRASKIAYLEKHHAEYDSYVLGASASSSFLPETLNCYTGAKFYNMIMYGADMLDLEQTCAYLIDNYEVKNIILNVAVTNGLHYDEEQSPILYNMHYKTNGTSPLSFYSRYLFMDPRYGLEKLQALGQNTLLSQPFDVFDTATGSYDKRARDAEGIGALDAYLAAYPEFLEEQPPSSRMAYTDASAESLARIRDKCDAANVKLTVVASPAYAPYLELFNHEDVEEFYTAMAEVTDFWDFSRSALSFDPRYFYDYSHFRNSVGEMALARMFGDGTQYIPADFGALVTRENVAQHMQSYWDTQGANPDTAVDLPILCYHALTEDPASVGDYTLLATDFRKQMQQLARGGYQPISLSQMEDFVLRGVPLPKNPILLTFDDGYESNYSLAYPILQEFNFPATIFVIGASVGSKEFYKDTTFPMTPHFDFTQAAEMVGSGLISVQSHSFDLHQWAEFEPENAAVRGDMLPLAGEREEDYYAVITADFEQSRTAIESATGEKVTALAYPEGKYTRLTQVALSEAGVSTTFSTTSGRNTLLMGLPQSLMCLHRFSVLGSTSPGELANYLAAAAVNEPEILIVPKGD